PCAPRASLVVGPAPARAPAPAKAPPPQIADTRLDLIGAHHSRRRIETGRHRSGILPVATALRVGALVESRHSSIGPAAPDQFSERRVVEPGDAQIGAGRRLVLLLVAVRKRAMACGASRSLPGGQPGFDPRLVLSDACDRRGEHSTGDDEGSPTVAQLTFEG